MEVRVSKLSREKQIVIITIWSELKKEGLSDKEILDALNHDYRKIYGEKCQEITFFEEALYAIRSWSDGKGGFDQAMKGWFDPDITLSVQAIKNSKNVDESIKLILDQLQTWQKIKSKIFMLLFSNSLIVAFALSIFTIITFAARYVVETFTMNSNFAPDSILLIFNDYIVSFWGYLVFFLIVILIIWYITLIYYTGEQRSELDRTIPFFHFYSANESSRFFVILSVIVMSGSYSLRAGLEFLKNSGLCSRYIILHIDEILFRLKHQKTSDNASENISFEKIDTGLLPDRLRLKLLAIQRVTKAQNKTSALKTISEDLVTLFGEGLIGKVEVIASFIKYAVLITVSAAALLFLDLTYSLSSVG